VDGKIFEENLLILAIWTTFLQIIKAVFLMVVFLFWDSVNVKMHFGITVILPDSTY
jgi:hypothetical protein